ALPAQGRGLEFHVGRWYNGNRADTYEFRTNARVGAGAAFTQGFGVAVLVNDSLGHRRAFYGAGYEIQGWGGRSSLGPCALARLEDRGPRGFWRPGSTARKGISAALGISIGVGKGERGRGSGGAGAPPDLPPAAPPITITGNAVDVVQTALESLGTPYVWGGTADNGFDCSGLVQYAYGQHGIRLPRMSR